MTEACWNNNKVNVFPVQTDAPLMGCRANFLLSESGRQSNRHSNHNPSHLWALRGNIHVPHYHPLCLMVYRDLKKNPHKHKSALFWGKLPHTPTQACLLLTLRGAQGGSPLGEKMQFSLPFNAWFCCRCENCVEMLFVRGSGNCVQCDTPLRKSNFRVQLFEDPTVDKEVEIRKKVLKMWVRGTVRVRGVVLGVYVSSHASSHFLSYLCLSHYTVCFVDNASPRGCSNGKALSLPDFYFSAPPCLLSLPCYLFFNSP